MPYMTYPQLKNSAKFRLAPFAGKLAGVTAIFLPSDLSPDVFVPSPAYLRIPSLCGRLYPFCLS